MSSHHARRALSTRRAGWALASAALLLFAGSTQWWDQATTASVNPPGGAAAQAQVPAQGPAHAPGHAPGHAPAPRQASATSRTSRTALTGIHKIRHVIVIMQENRSFDSYFGTYPGADGIPRRHGRPTVCVPDPQTGGCVRPYLDNSYVDHGGLHGLPGARGDIDHGRMDGFIAMAEQNKPSAVARQVMAYHNEHGIPNYWAYARHFVLQDHMFAPSKGWSLPEHLYQVSEWSAECRHAAVPMSCRSSLWLHAQAALRRIGHPQSRVRFGWTDLTYLLHQQHVSWRYYVRAGIEPDCENDSEQPCVQAQQRAQRGGIWNPLPLFTTVRRDHQVGDVQPVSRFFYAARNGTLPAVAWVTPAGQVSEHPPSSVGAGQAYVTRLIDAIMRGPDWHSCAIFLSWDEWGGLYDHMAPPHIDYAGYGLRVPGLVISPYARRGFVDHQLLSHDAYVKCIEDDFLHGQRINPRTDGRPDRRPNVRENNPRLGDLRRDFDFQQAPRRPLILRPWPGIR